MKTKSSPYSQVQITWLVVLRMLIGWHFLYEGIVKVMNPKWTSYGYLLDSKGWFEGLYHSLADNSNLLKIADFMNEWGLVLIGLGLIVGCLSRAATIGGIVLLAFYYLSHPAFIGADYMMPAEGAYLWIDKNLIEMAALAVIFVFPTSQIIGLDRYIFKNKRN